MAKEREIEIRKATVSDSAGILECLHEGFETYREAYTPEALFGGAHFVYMKQTASLVPIMTAACARILGLCDRGWLRRGGRRS
jgi:hypothetical protein